jgi:RNA polymerase sigma-70 factor (ECF subfamily)
VRVSAAVILRRVDDDELVGLLAGVVDLEAARAAWPEVQLSPQTFLEHLASSLRARGRADDPAAWAARLHLSDLYLACGCLAGDEAALRGFEPILQAVPGILRSLSTDPGFVGDVRATVAEELFVHRPGKSPKIARYSGEGSLRSWFTVIVQRTALGLKRGAGNVPLASTDDFSDLLIGGFDPELELLREKFLPQLQSAMREAAGRLTRRDRIILRLSMV